MQKRLGFILVTALLVAVIPFANVFAVTTPTSTEPSEPTASPITKTTDIEDDKTVAGYQAKLEERLEKRKAALQAKLTAKEQAFIKTRCKAAQTVVAKVSDKAKEAKTNRETIYTNIMTRVTTLRDKLKSDGKDTAKLDANIIELQALIDKFNADLKELRQSAADVSTMDCQTAPVGFKASIEAMRTSRETLQADSEAIRAYIKDALKPVLKELRTASEQAKKEGTN